MRPFRAVTTGLTLALGITATLAAADPVHDDTMRLLGHVLADGTTSDEEKVLLEKLRNARKPLDLDLGNGSERFVPPDEDHRELLAFFQAEPDFEPWWLKGERETRLLIWASNARPGSSKDVDQFLMKKVYSAWNRSNINNAYAPLRKVIGDFTDQLGPEDGEVRKRGYALIFDTTRRVDGFLKGAIPDFIYEAYDPNSPTNRSDSSATVPDSPTGTRPVRPVRTRSRDR